MKIYDFRIEYREEPKGLAVRIPRFSWKIASDEKNVAQASWQIIVDCDGSCVLTADWSLKKKRSTGYPCRSRITMAAAHRQRRSLLRASLTAHISGQR